MKKKIFIIYCWDGYPEYCWYPWLKAELEARGHEAIVSEMPQSHEPRINKWVPELIKQVGKVDCDTYFVGHSMGNQAIARFLEQLSEDQVAGGAVFVAGFFDRLTGLEDDPVVRSVVQEWLETDIDFSKTKNHLGKNVAIFSDNDPYVPLDNADTFEKEFGSEIMILKNRGHFSGTDYKELLEVLKKLESIGV